MKPITRAAGVSFLLGSRISFFFINFGLVVVETTRVDVLLVCGLTVGVSNLG